MPDENETVDEKQRAERMKAWLASLPEVERAGFESAIVNTPRHTPEEIAAALQEALKQLPEEQRMAVFLRLRRAELRRGVGAAAHTRCRRQTAG